MTALEWTLTITLGGLYLTLLFTVAVWPTRRSTSPCSSLVLCSLSAG